MYGVPLTAPYHRYKQSDIAVSRFPCELRLRDLPTLLYCSVYASLVSLPFIRWLVKAI